MGGGNKVECVFRLHYGSARQVYLAGAFGEAPASAVPMRHAGGETWEARIELPPGRYAYQYYVVRDVPPAGAGRRASAATPAADVESAVEIELINEGSVVNVPYPGPAASLN